MIAPPTRRKVLFHRFAERHPFVYLFLLAVVSNAAGSIFNIVYNLELIVRQLMDARQTAAFHFVALPTYNLLAYAICFGMMIFLIVPLARCRRRLAKQEAVAPAELDYCRRRLVNLPFLAILINFWGWMPGAVAFPALVCGFGGSNEAGEIWKRFAISFFVSAFYTTAQTFFLMESFFVRVLYPEFFQDARAADVRGAVILPFGIRMLGLWLAVGVMPLAALFVVAFYSDAENLATLKWLTMLIAASGGISGLFIFQSVKGDMENWIAVHAAATEAVSREDFAVRIEDQRPDEWGRLTDGFNDMAAALGRAEVMRETFGQFVSPQVRDAILQRYPGLQVSVQEITVLFADIRGFTSRCAGEAPELVGDLLNRFLTLAVGAVEDNGGYVNKFLGDGVLALFGAAQNDPRQADRALGCAREMLERLARLNDALRQGSQAPLVVGIGIHTGPALVGCFGATLAPRDGPARIRREFSAIGETVNVGQRIEQMTKQLGGPILLSAVTRDRLSNDVPLVDRGRQTLPGVPKPVQLFQCSD